MTNGYRIKTSMEECLIKSAHASIRHHLERLRDFQLKGKLPEDPLELRTTSILLSDRLAHAKRLHAQMRERAEQLDEDEDLHGLICGEILAVADSVAAHIQDMELLEYEGQKIITGLQDLRPLLHTQISHVVQASGKTLLTVAIL